MAHIAKYKADQIAPLVRHYERSNRNYGNGNIDSFRTAGNTVYVSRPEGAEAFVESRIAELHLRRKPRKDAVRMCACVLTLPRDVRAGDDGTFFDAAYRFLAGRYGEGNIVSAVVHRDETQPHLHYAWVPVTHDGRLCAKDVVDRADLQTLHPDLNAAVDAALGYHVSVVLDEGQVLDKAISKLPQAEMAAVRAELAGVRAEVERLGSVAAGMDSYIADAAGELDGVTRQLQETRERASKALRSLERVEGRVTELQAVSEALRDDNAALKVENDSLRQQVSVLRKMQEALDRVLAKLTPYLPEPLRVLARAIQRDDHDEVERVSNAIMDAAFELADEMPTEWEEMLDTASRRAVDANEGRASVEVCHTRIQRPER